MNGKSMPFSALIAVLAAATGTGCTSKREPVALSISVNPTITAGERRARGYEHLKTIVRGAYLPKGSVVQVVRDDCDAKVVYEGPVLAQEVLAAYDEALTGGRNCGNDCVRCLEQQRAWLMRQRARGFKRLILTGWTDLRVETCKVPGRRPRTFAPIESMRWPGAKDIDVALYGVPPDEARALEKRWGPQLRTCALYGPAHRITAADLGLTRRGGL